MPAPGRAVVETDLRPDLRHRAGAWRWPASKVDRRLIRLHIELVEIRGVGHVKPLGLDTRLLGATRPALSTTHLRPTTDWYAVPAADAGDRLCPGAEEIQTIVETVVAERPPVCWPWCPTSSAHSISPCCTTAAGASCAPSKPFRRGTRLFRAAGAAQCLAPESIAAPTVFLPRRG